MVCCYIRCYIPGSFSPPHKGIGIPLVSRLSSSVNGSDIRDIYLGLLNQFREPSEDASSNSVDLNSISVKDSTTTTSKEDALPPVSDAEHNSSDKRSGDLESVSEFQLYMTDEKGIARQSRIIMDEPVVPIGTSGRLNVLVCWPEKLTKEHNPSFFSPLPEIFKPGFFAKRPQETVSLYKCLEAFLTEEPLGPEDMWLVFTLPLNLLLLIACTFIVK